MSTKKGEKYKCEICGNLVEILEEASGILVCCGKPMKLQK
jgi:superoxide reductase